MLVLESQTPSKSVTYVSGLNCYLCARLDNLADLQQEHIHPVGILESSQLPSSVAVLRDGLGGR